jgi:hypothetical protein
MPGHVLHHSLGRRLLPGMPIGLAGSPDGLFQWGKTEIGQLSEDLAVVEESAAVSDACALRVSNEGFLKGT